MIESPKEEYLKKKYRGKSERLLFCSMDETDSEKYRLLRNRKDNSAFFFSKGEITAEQQIKWFRTYLTQREEYMFAIRNIESGDFIGGIGIYHIDFSNGEGEVGRIIIDKRTSKGRGFGAEAIRFLCKEMYCELGINTFTAKIYTNNIPSIKSFENAGFIRDDKASDKEIASYEMKL